MGWKTKAVTATYQEGNQFKVSKEQKQQSVEYYSATIKKGPLTHNWLTNVLYWVWATSLKRLHAVWVHLHDILDKAKL